MAAAVRQEGTCSALVRLRTHGWAPRAASNVRFGRAQQTPLRHPSTYWPLSSGVQALSLAVVASGSKISGPPNILLLKLRSCWHV